VGEFPTKRNRSNPCHVSGIYSRLLFFSSVKNWSKKISLKNKKRSHHATRYGTIPE